MKHVFISYSRKDINFVRRFVDDLRSVDIKVWIDEHNLTAGTPDWEQAIRDALRDADVILLIGSVASRQSPYVRGELRIAKMEDKDKLIIPVWAKGEDGREADCFPLNLIETQFLDARNNKYDDALKDLIRILRGENYHPVLDRAKCDAQEWDAVGRPDYLLWPWEKQTQVYEVIEQLQPDLDEVTQAFLVPEYERLLEEYEVATFHRKQNIIDRWVVIGELCVPTIVKAFFIKRSSDWYITRAELTFLLIKALKPFKDIAGKHFIDLLQNDDSVVRQIAVESLEELLGQSALAYIRPMLQDKDTDVLKAVIRCLAKLRDYQSSVSIIPYLQHSENSIRWAATNALDELSGHQKTPFGSFSGGELGELDVSQIISSLIPLLHDEDIRLRYKVVSILQNLGNKYDVVTYLIPVLYDDDVSVRLLALDLLEKFKDIQTLPHLIRLLDDHTPLSEGRTISLQAAWILSQMKTTESRKALREWRKKYPEIAPSLRKYSSKRYRFSTTRSPLHRDEDE